MNLAVTDSNVNDYNLFHVVSIWHATKSLGYFSGTKQPKTAKCFTINRKNFTKKKFLPIAILNPDRNTICLEVISTCSKFNLLISWDQYGAITQSMSPIRVIRCRWKSSEERGIEENAA